MIAILFAALVASVPCTSPRPADTPLVAWTCVDGGWRPASPVPVPPTPVPPPPVPPPTAQPLLVPEFRVGRTYKRDASGALVFVLGFGVASNGVAVLALECLNEAVHDQCFFPGQGRIIVANANALGWTEQ